jgi:hypothetical protein
MTVKIVSFVFVDEERGGARRHDGSAAFGFLQRKDLS